MLTSRPSNLIASDAPHTSGTDHKSLSAFTYTTMASPANVSDLVEGVKACNAKNRPVRVCVVACDSDDETDAPPLLTTTAILYFNGYALAELVEPGSKGRSIEFYEAEAKELILATRANHPGVDDRALAKFFLHSLHGLCNELYAAFGHGGLKSNGLRRVRKLWGDNFEQNHKLWFDFVLALMILGVIQNDEENGWHVYETEEKIARGMFANSADQVYDTCVCCAKRGSFRRCPCSKSFRYCSAECSKLDWNAHKSIHKQKMAKRAAKAD